MTPEELAFYDELFANIEAETLDCEPSQEDIDDYNPEEDEIILEEINAIYFSSRI